MKARLAGLVVLASLSGTAFAEQPSEVLLGLAGSCWTADFGEGASDTHCFSVARGGNLMMDMHKVRSRSGAATYEGVSLYRLDKSAGAVRYDYYNSNGDLMSGYVIRKDERLVFSKQPGGVSDVVWYLGKDAYEVGTAAVTAAKRKYVRAGPAPDGGF